MSEFRHRTAIQDSTQLFHIPMKLFHLTVTFLLVAILQFPEKPGPDLPAAESPADTRVMLFLQGTTNFVDESDLQSCRPDLREKAWEKLD